MSDEENKNKFRGYSIKKGGASRAINKGKESLLDALKNEED